MATTRQYGRNGNPNERTFDDLSYREPSPLPRRLSPIRLRPNNQDYQDREIRNQTRFQQPSQSNKSNFCSKPCLIGLCIGLIIGMILVIAIAVPIGVTRCGTNNDATVATTACTTVTTITTTTTPLNCLGVVSQTANWTGTYLADDACSSSTSCCCFYNQIRLNQTIGFQLQITGPVTTPCVNIGFAGTVTIQMPTAFRVNIPWGSIQIIRLQLGRDNSYLSFVNIDNPTCSFTAMRTS